jgi:xanthine dehydrogenase molybdopterin-binding subunit B
MTYDEVIEKGLPTRYEGKWSVPGTDQDVVTGQGNPFANYMYGVLLAEVKVNMTTGKATVEQLTIVADVGKVGNKLLTDGQIYGGLAQGIGLALTEDYEDITCHLKPPCLQSSKNIPIWLFSGCSEIFAHPGTCMPGLHSRSFPWTRTEILF